MLPQEKAAAKERQAHGETAPGKRLGKVSTSVVAGKTRDKLGAFAGVSGLVAWQRTACRVDVDTDPKSRVSQRGIFDDQIRSYVEFCWYGPNPAAPIIQASGTESVERASIVRRQLR